ncbi:TetR/AcrR family transcriptional regulator [Agromyces sp. MMS24-K17]|uniref:TetR/AcrR family transcriptional regulator n=1 Tax=Agromyces sp. MMS24-K17 TaxID=3372850 RepID=UPI003754338B
MSNAAHRVEASVRRRPRDRRQQIEAAAALAFAERGYHQVSMQEVAAAVGISAPALYRHFPNKYALFSRTVFDLAHRLVEATEGGADASGAELLDARLDALITTTIELRATGGVYRWEGRYLEPDDRVRLFGEFRIVRERIATPFAELRPELSDEDRDLLVWAALAAIASITAYRAVVSARALRDLLADAAHRLLAADLPADDGAERRLAATPAASSRREKLIAEAIALFHARGYHEVGMEEIAAAAGLTASGVYRHFDGKSALLLEACERAARQLEAATLTARAASSSPDEVLRALCDDYVRHSFEHAQLMGVYASDVGALDPDDRRRLRALQRAYVAEWVEELVRARPELSARDALVLVHAGFNVVADVGSALRHRTNPATSRRVSSLLRVTLGLDG